MAMINSDTSVVCDAGPIIHLNEIGCTYLMRDFGKVIVPEKVRQEVLEYRPEALEDTGIVWKWISHPFALE